MTRSPDLDRSPHRRGSRPAPAGYRTEWLIAAALVAAVLVLYGQTAQFEFVSMDDLEFIVQNPHVRAGITGEGFAWSLTALQPNWHPVTWWSHMLDVELFGLSPGGHHLTSAGLHAVNSALFFLAIRLMTGATWPSALATALFAFHPLRAESVAWLSERKDVVSGLFWMLTLLAYGWYVRRPTVARYLSVAAALGLGMMSKTMLVSLPIVLLLLDVWPLRRLSLADRTVPRSAGGDADPAPALSHVLLEKVPLFLIALAGVVLSMRTQHTVAGTKGLDDVPLDWRLVNAPLAYISYLRKSLWPSDLAGLYPHPALIGIAIDGFVWPAILATTVIAAVSVLCVLARRRRPYLAVGWFWYLIALLPVIGLVQVGMQSMADRYTYLSMPGLYIALAWTLRDIIDARPHLRVPIVTGVALILTALGVASWAQIGTWRNSTTLYEQGLAVTEGNHFMHASFGAVLRADGDTAGAERHLREALRIRPDEPFTRMQLGTLLQETGRLDEAAEQHEAALRLDPDYTQARGNLGVVRLRQGRAVEAERELRAALAREPGYGLAVTNLGAALLAQERWAEAAAVLRQAVALSPDAPDAHNNLGVALVRIGDLRGAEAEFVATLRLRPGHANATRSLEYVRGALGGR